MSETGGKTVRFKIANESAGVWVRASMELLDLTPEDCAQACRCSLRLIEYAMMGMPIHPKFAARLVRILGWDNWAFVALITNGAARRIMKRVRMVDLMADNGKNFTCKTRRRER